MTPFTQHRGVALPLLRDNIDTDAIIPFAGNAHRVALWSGSGAVGTLALP